MAIASLDYIDVDERGVARVAGHRVKVIHLVMCQRGNGLTAEQLAAEFPDLTAAEVYAALAYYHANKATLDAQIEESIRFADEMRAKHEDQPTREEYLRRLAANGRADGPPPPAAP